MIDTEFVTAILLFDTLFPHPVTGYKPPVPVTTLTTFSTLGLSLKHWAASFSRTFASPRLLPLYADHPVAQQQQQR
jgi:hypothetical protein